MIPYEKRIRRGPITARELARKMKISERKVQYWTAIPRNQWLQDNFERREAVRAYHDDEGHSWAQTGKHFEIRGDSAKKLGYRARKERAAERAAEAQGETLFDNVER